MIGKGIFLRNTGEEKQHVFSPCAFDFLRTYDADCLIHKRVHGHLQFLQKEKPPSILTFQPPNHEFQSLNFISQNTDRTDLQPVRSYFE